MGIAERMAAEISRQRIEFEQQNQLARERDLEKAEAIAKHVPGMWSSLTETLKTEVEKFSKLEKSAEGLSALSQSVTHLLIQTSAFPIIKVNIFKTYDGFVSVDMTQIVSGFGPARQAKPERFRFTVDEQLSPCFVDDSGRQYTVELLAEEILKPIFTFLADPSISDSSIQFR
ncbi:MAG TPA: hypothetical protein VI636_21295 [Candidatus Angelobacter sp.]